MKIACVKTQAFFYELTFTAGAFEQPDASPSYQSVCRKWPKVSQHLKPFPYVRSVYEVAAKLSCDES